MEETAGLRRFLPILAWGPGSRKTLGRDLIAGATLWGLVVPEGMAYASMAGMPAEAGLYTIMVSLIAYAFLGSSRQLVVVATSATAALTASTVAAFGPKDVAEYAAYAAALVLVVGVLFLIAGFLRLGFVAQFLSRPVMDGFIIGLAIFVAVGQLHKLFGVDKGDGNSPQLLWHTLTELGQTNAWTLGVAVLSLAALFLLPQIAPRLPTGLVVLAVAIVASNLLDLAGQHNVEVVGKLPQGLPGVGIPEVSVPELLVLIPAAAGILLVAYSEALATAQAFARRHDYQIDPNQELIAYGGANLVSGAVGGLVACGGMSGSAVNDGAGARTQMSGITAAILGMITVVALTPLFTALPEATLAALIIHAVSHMMKPQNLEAVYRLSRKEFYLGLMALFGVILIDVLTGLILAMVASILLVIYRSSRASVVAIGALPMPHGSYGALSRHPDAVAIPGVLVLRLDAPMYYANASSNEEEIKRLVLTTRPPVHAVVFDPEVQHELDVTSVEMLTEVVGWMHERDVKVYVVTTHSELTRIAERTGLTAKFGAEYVVQSLDEALEKAGR